MLKTKNAITVCVNTGFNLDVHEVIDNHVDTIGAHHVYLDGDKVYIGFKTKRNISEVANTLKEKLYKSKTNVVGGLIFVNFE